MKSNQRHAAILTALDENGFQSYDDLSRVCGVSEMTIRRDIQTLGQARLIQQVLKGAMPILPVAVAAIDGSQDSLTDNSAGLLIERVDALVATALNPEYTGKLLDLLGEHSLPMVAESAGFGTEKTLVSPDLDKTGCDLGRWAGEYARDNWSGRLNILDLTYYIPNTQQTSNSFLEGVHQVVPDAEVTLSVNVVLTNDVDADSLMAYQMTRDALTVYPQINLIIAINDLVAMAAMRACRDMKRNQQDTAVLTFGIENSSMVAELVSDGYLRAGLAMFPQIVGPVCLDAAIAAFQGMPLPRQLVCPHAVLTPDNICDYYHLENGVWMLIPEVQLRLANEVKLSLSGQPLPRRIGFLVPFRNHAWYRSVVEAMQAQARRRQVELEIVDVDQSLQSELHHRRIEIARLALQFIQPEDVILMDGGAINDMLAQALPVDKPVTVMTNSQSVFQALLNNPAVTLISTGGAYRRASKSFVGPTAENTLRNFRADKLFLATAGFSMGFGLSHPNISEVTLKQAMIRSARQVILLADYTNIGEDAAFQVAPISVIHRLVTDDTLPPSFRLELSRAGIQVTLASN